MIYILVALCPIRSVICLPPILIAQPQLDVDRRSPGSIIISRMQWMEPLKLRTYTPKPGDVMETYPMAMYQNRSKSARNRSFGKGSKIKNGNNFMCMYMSSIQSRGNTTFHHLSTDKHTLNAVQHAFFFSGHISSPLDTQGPRGVTNSSCRCSQLNLSPYWPSSSIAHYDRNADSNLDP